MEKRNLKNLRIIRILLGCPGGSLTKYRIAKMAECTKPWVIEFLRKLEKIKIVRKTKLLNFDKLVDYYLDIAPKQRYAEYYVQNPLGFLKASKLIYALTTYGAENLLNHQLFPTRYDVYTRQEDFDEWKGQIMKNGLLGSGNLRLIIAEDERLFKETQTLNGVKTVPLSQLLIDLKREGGVCLDAYKTLVRKHLKTVAEGGVFVRGH